MKNAATKKMFSFIIVMMFSLPFIMGQKSFVNQECHKGAPDLRHAINPIIGDISFVSKFGYAPDETTDEDLRIRTHLEYAENLLRQRDISCLSPELQQKRIFLLDLLHEYWSAGKFPRNYDFMSERRPCFIDKDNTICAVGYLVEQTVGRHVAEAINEEHKYDFVMAMNNSMVDTWIENSGLTKEECATIQPDYGGWGNPCSGNNVYTCRTSNCVTECKCINPNKVNQWVSQAKPCNDDGNNGNGNGGNGNGNGNGNNGNGGDSLSIIRIQTPVERDFAENIYPNPLVNLARIYFSLEDQQTVSIKIFDMKGRLITTLADASFDEGVYELEWDATNVQSGIYVLLIETPDSLKSQKVIVAK